MQGTAEMRIVRNLAANLFRRVQFIVKTLLSLAKTNELAFVKQSRVLLLCHDANRGYTYKGKKYAQLLDSINDRLQEEGIETVTLATPLSFIVSKDAYGKVFSANRLLLQGIISDKVRRIVFKRDHLNRGRLKAWNALFDHIRPAVVIGIQPTPEMCIAARDRGIFIADLQHGLLYDEEGYYGTDHRKKYNQDGWPDCVLCWDEASAEHIRSNAPASVDARVIGNPWFLRFLYSRQNDPLVSSIFVSNPATDEKPVILVTLQWGMERFFEVHPSGLPYCLLEFIRQGGENFVWWLRLHPVQLQEPVRSRIEGILSEEFTGLSNVFWSHCSEEPLPVVLKQVRLHLTAHSAVTLEASWFNVPTGLLDERHDLLKSWFSKELSEGLAEIIEPNQAAVGQWMQLRLSEMAARKSRPNYISPAALDMFISEVGDRLAATKGQVQIQA